MHNTIIGIAGGSGSGKTTLARSIIERFGDKVALISHDSCFQTVAVDSRVLNTFRIQSV